MKFRGEIGFANTVEIAPGKWREEIVARTYRGSVTTNARRFSTGDTVTGQIQSGHILSIIGDKYAFMHAYDIRYAVFQGVKWTVAYAELTRPRIRLTLGARYNG